MTVLGGYKGFGLGMMVELFCGILSGSKFGTQVRTWTDAGFSSAADLVNDSNSICSIIPCLA